MTTGPLSWKGGIKKKDRPEPKEVERRHEPRHVGQPRHDEQLSRVLRAPADATAAAAPTAAAATATAATALQPVEHAVPVAAVAHGRRRQRWRQRRRQRPGRVPNGPGRGRLLGLVLHGGAGLENGGEDRVGATSKRERRSRGEKLVSRQERERTAVLVCQFKHLLELN